MAQDLSVVAGAAAGRCDDGTWAADVAFYLANLPGWAEHQGEHVLIYRSQAHGFYPSRSDAMGQGFRRFGNVSFLVKQVDLDEKPRPLVGVII